MRIPLPVTRTALLAIVTTALMGSAGLASAHPGPPPNTGNPHGTHAHCKAAQADVADARLHLSHVKHTGKPATKVHAAKADLQQQRQQASRICSKAKSEAAATALATADDAGWAALAADTTLTGLPTSMHDTVVADAAAAQTQVDALAPQITGARTPQLAHLVNRLRALDPTRLQAALTDLNTALSAYTGDPTNLLTGVVDALAAFNPAGHPTGLQALAGAVEDAAQAVAAANAAAPTP